MTAAQLGLFAGPTAAPPKPDAETEYVWIPRTRLLAFAAHCEANGLTSRGSAIRTACEHVWRDDPVRVGRTIATLWGIEP